jgi:hypothetical protein
MNTKMPPWVCHLCDNKIEEFGGICNICKKPVCQNCIGRIKSNPGGMSEIECKKCYSESENK